jgi:hypothetical protein
MQCQGPTGAFREQCFHFKNARFGNWLSTQERAESAGCHVAAILVRFLSAVDGCDHLSCYHPKSFSKVDAEDQKPSPWSRLANQLG